MAASETRQWLLACAFQRGLGPQRRPCTNFHWLGLPGAFCPAVGAFVLHMPPGRKLPVPSSCQLAALVLNSESQVMPPTDCGLPLQKSFFGFPDPEQKGERALGFLRAVPSKVLGSHRAAYEAILAPTREEACYTDKNEASFMAC